MSTKAQKITLSVSRDIPFDKLRLAQSNVRRIKAGVSIEELAEDIARRTLLQSLTVRPVLDDDGKETGMYEVPAGGRRYRALELLVKRKRLAKTALVPCVIREGGIAEEDSLAENVQRAPLHPLDQFRAFLTLREKGQSEDDIAAAFFVSVAVVKQRLRLASVSPKLLDIYAEDGMTLDQLMAFTVNGDHARQEQVFENLSQSYSKEPYAIRRMLLEGSVRASDKRARFIGIDTYVEAGGIVLNDLFQSDDGGWLEDVALVDRLVAEKLDREAEAISAEGWSWIEVAPEFPYGHTYGLRHLRGEEIPLTADEEAAREALKAEYEQLEESWAEADDLPDEADQRFSEIEAALEAFEARPVRFDPDEIARAGAFVSIDAEGNPRVERGFVRPEDEVAIETEPEADGGRALAASVETDAETARSGSATMSEPEEDDDIKPIPDRLMAELTAHRTLALRHALSLQPEIAFIAALHALCIKAFYRYAVDSCLELDLKSVAFGSQAPGLNDTGIAASFERRHQTWIAALPKDPADLWDGLMALDGDSHRSLFAHCVSLSVNAMFETYNRRPRALAHADRLAEALDLDMVAAGWTPTVDSYLGRVTKARILATVREAKGEAAAQSIDHLKKGEMAGKAEALIAGTGWLPEPLRTPGRMIASVAEEDGEAAISGIEGVEASTCDGETAMAETGTAADDEPVTAETPTVAAE